MRIQHNIMAMSAYRNYTNNVSAMKKNLERLSSGYKINRAGDDAAGLAISEKMRAQITGLETAQKNAKDGISLVQTAEGALTEVHDMLNRMVELASMSANGTYDNSTDRAQLQKEMDQLKAEINRIADSSNFNGIKLLDGSMDTSAITGVKYDAVTSKKLQSMFVNGFENDDWKGVTQASVDGGMNVLETEGGATSRAGFEISLDGISITAQAGDVFTLDVGGVKLKATLDTAGKTYTATDLAKAIAEQNKNKFSVKIDGVGTVSFDMVADGKVLKFTVDENVEDDFKMFNNAKVTWTVGSGTKEPPEEIEVTWKGKDPTFANGSANSPAKITIDLEGLGITGTGVITITLGSSVTRAVSSTGVYSYDITITKDDFGADGKIDLSKVATKLMEAINTAKDIVGSTGLFTATVSGGKVILTAANNGAISNSSPLTKLKMNIEPKKTSGSGGGGGGGGVTNITITGANTVASVTSAGSASSAAKLTYSLGSTTLSGPGTVKVTIAGKSYEIKITASDIAKASISPLADVILNRLKTAIGSTGIKFVSSKGSITFKASIANGKLVLTAQSNGSISATDLAKLKEFKVEGGPAEAEKMARGGGVLRADAKPGYTAGTPKAETGGVKVSSGIANASWAGSKVGVNLVGGTMSIEIGGKDYKIKFVASAGASVAAGYIAVNVGSTSASMAGSAVLTAVVTALQQHFDYVVNKEAASKAGDSYAKIDEISLQVSSSATSGLVVSYKETQFTKITDNNNNNNDTNNKVQELAPVQILKLNGVDFAASSTLKKTLASLAPNALEEFKKVTEIKVGANSEIKVDLSDIMKNLKGSDTVESVLGSMKTAIDAALKAWNKANPDSDFDYVFVEFRSGNSTVMRDVGDFLEVVIGKQTRETPPSGGSTRESGTINTGLQNVTDNNSGASAQLANTVVDFSKVNAWQDGAQITIGDTTYTVALGEDSKFKNVKNVIDLTDLKADDANLAKIAAQRLTVAANDNSIFIVGHNGLGQTTLKQRSEAKESTDMSTKEKVLGYLGVSLADADSITTAQPGKALTLQIGDTADSYNQLNVSIGDAHTAALGLDGINISTQEGAAAAIDKIKAAINTVSDIRGTLGATQNRLDHTINNLSVMTENIQDAESTIRDTDIAEEMMAYTKNNILIQSAQAMLAQANQVPQGVLQLLQ